MHEITSKEELKRHVKKSFFKILSDLNTIKRPLKIYFHWSGEDYNKLMINHHINIDHDGAVFLATEDLHETLEHTKGRNVGSISICLTGCKNAEYIDEQNIRLGDEPINDVQIDKAVEVAGEILKEFKYQPTLQHVVTSSEAAMDADGISLFHQKYSPGYCEEPIWDMDILHEGDEPHSGGRILRSKIKEYMKKAIR